MTDPQKERERDETQTGTLVVEKDEKYGQGKVISTSSPAESQRSAPPATTTTVSPSQQEQQQQQEGVYNVARLIENLKSDNTAQRLESIRQLNIIAIALGQRRTREELIRFLHERMRVDTDEICAELAERMLPLSKLVGGGSHTTCILPLLESLASSESQIVREKAVTSLLGMAKYMVNPDFCSSFVKLTDRLLTAHWYNCRTSGIAIMHVALRGANDEQKQALLKRLIETADEQAAVVRTEAAKHFGKIVAETPSSMLFPDLAAFIYNLATDRNPSTRGVCINNIPIVVERLANTEKEMPESSSSITEIRKKLLKQMMILSNDTIWRVRDLMARSAPEFARVSLATGYVSSSEILAMFMRLINDKEEDVRVEATNSLVEFTRQFTNHVVCEVRGINEIDGSSDGKEKRKFDMTEIILADTEEAKKIDEKLEEVCTFITGITDHLESFDESVRVMLAFKLSEIAPIIGPHRTVTTLVPIIGALAGDKSTDVSLAFVTQAHIIGDVLKKGDTEEANQALEQLRSVVLSCLPTFFSCSMWRIREGAARACMEIGFCFGQDFFKEKVLPMLHSILVDPVHSVRIAAVSTLLELLKRNGEEWFGDVVLPEVMFLADELNYLHRSVLGRLVEAAMGSFEEPYLSRYLLPIIEKQSTDRVPNVRLIVARAMIRHSSKFTIPETIERANNLLEKFKADPDPDVALCVPNTNTAFTSSAPKNPEAIPVYEHLAFPTSGFTLGSSSSP